MIDGMRIQAVITARGGSKGLPGKNVLPLAGKPLIAWTVEAALACPLIDDLILSSDDDEICAAAAAAGCRVPFRRPPELASDTATSLDVLRHAVETLPQRPDVVVLLQPTSPLRTAEDLSAAIRLMVDRGAPACIGVTECKKPPHWIFRRDTDGHLAPILDAPPPSRRQEAESLVTINGAVYVARTDWLFSHGGFLGPETVAYVMPADRSVDIDDHLDFKLAEFLMLARDASS